MSKQLKLWNGRAGRAAHLIGAESFRNAHAFVAAHSAADVLRMFDDLLDGNSDVTAHEIKNYWSANAWGNTMRGITPERGIWIASDVNKPIRVYPEAGVLPVGTLTCPHDGEKLWFEILGQVRIRRKAGDYRDIYKARCPKCGKEFDVKAPKEEVAKLTTPSPKISRPAPAVLSVRQFEQWLDERRNRDVSEIFHDLVAHYSAALTG